MVKSFSPHVRITLNIELRGWSDIATDADHLGIVLHEVLNTRHGFREVRFDRKTLDLIFIMPSDMAAGAIDKMRLEIQAKGQAAIDAIEAELAKK